MWIEPQIVGALAIAATVSVGVSAVGAGAIRAAQAAGAADAAALAAADAASGAATGIPCERAAQVASASGAYLAACSLDGMIATVRVGVGAGPFAAVGRARAGPPPSLSRASAPGERTGEGTDAATGEP